MQMFANPDVALEGLRGCTVGIEAETDFRRDLERLATSIGCEPLALPAGVALIMPRRTMSGRS